MGATWRRPYPRYVTDEWADAAEARLLTAFEQGLGGLPTAAPAEPHVIRGRAARVLVAMADQPHDLLVIGMRHPGFPRRTGCGQVARHCLAHATCPVIAVPPTGLATAAGRTLRGLPLQRAPRDGSTVIDAETLDAADQEGHRNRLQ
jgi:Universal stress protein family